MSNSDIQVREIVRRVVHQTLGLSDNSTHQARSAPLPKTSSSGERAITESTIATSKRGTQIVVPRGVLVTPLARQTAGERGITLVESPAVGVHASSHTAMRNRTVALGTDHGGVALRDTLKTYIEELEYTLIDCGTHSTDAVDYPDFALAVAEWVASGRAWRGIVIDGAGIGSSMAANKVPGVRAALCYDQATARNSREHNDANVLTLGAGLIGTALAKQIVKIWLETDFGGGRHARRVNKIIAIEKRFSKK